MPTIALPLVAMPTLPSPPAGSPFSWALLRAFLALAFFPLATLPASGVELGQAPVAAKDTAAKDTAAKDTAAKDAAAKEDKSKRSAEKLEEYTVKAELLYSFLKYSKFPDGTFAHKKSPIVVLILGDDPFGPLLKKAFAKKKLDGRSIQIRRLKRIPNRTCAHLVFAHGLKKKGREKLIAELCTQPCLLVADTPGFAEAGGFINLYMDEDRVRFEINKQCLKTTGVQLKTEFLKLARIVTARPAPVEKQS